MSLWSRPLRHRKPPHQATPTEPVGKCFRFHPWTDVWFYGFIEFPFFPFQISHSFISQILSDKTQLPFFYPMLPAEEVQYLGMVKLVLYFRWTLVGLLAPDTEYGERFMRTLSFLLVKNGICPVLSTTFSLPSWKIFFDFSLYLNWRKVNVFMYGADVHTFNVGVIIMHKIFEELTEPLKGKVLITTLRWDFTIYLKDNDLPAQYIHSIFFFLMKRNQMAKYGGYLRFSSFMFHLIKKSFLCSYTTDDFSVKVWRRCREREELEALRKEEMDPVLVLDSYFIYNAIWAVAWAINAAHLSSTRRRFKGVNNMKAPMLKAWQVFLFYGTAAHFILMDVFIKLVGLPPYHSLTRFSENQFYHSKLGYYSENNSNLF